MKFWKLNLGWLKHVLITLSKKSKSEVNSKIKKILKVIFGINRYSYF